MMLLLLQPKSIILTVIREFFEQKEVPVEYQHIRNAVKSFNAFNGEWLLRVIGSKSQYPREKLRLCPQLNIA